MNRIIWRRIGRQPTFRKLAACFDGILYALDETGRLLVNQNFGLDGSWHLKYNLPTNVVNLTCAAGIIYYQTADRTLWYVSGSGAHIRAGKPWGAAAIAGTEDITLDFSILWALNDDKTLWRNAVSGADGQWHKIGQPHSAWKIAASQNTLFALNHDRSFWMNSNGGLDGLWEHLDLLPETIEITAASEGQSGAIQLYALHDDFTIWNGVIIPDCKVCLTTQNAYPVTNPHANWFSLVGLGDLGVTTNVWTMGGFALEVKKGDTVDQFLEYSESQIRSKLKSYLKKYQDLKPKTKDLVILDMESPAAPSGFGKPENRYRIDAIIKAYRTRIRIARQELDEAKLALYGVIVPEAQGDPNKKIFRDRMEGYRIAADSGLFEEVDFLSPVLYTRWGPDDACGPNYRRKYCTLAARIRMGIIQTAGLTNKPLIPLLSLKVFNRNSLNHAQNLTSEISRAQLNYIQSRPGVNRVVYWVPPRPSNELYNSAAEILTFFRRLNPCGS